jgi:hypothetical protein
LGQGAAAGAASPTPGESPIGAEDGDAGDME